MAEHRAEAYDNDKERDTSFPVFTVRLRYLKWQYVKWQYVDRDGCDRFLIYKSYSHSAI